MLEYSKPSWGKAWFPICSFFITSWQYSMCVDDATPCGCMGSVLVLTARFASPGHHPILLGGTPLWNAAGAASSISSSAAKLPRLRARILLICGLISWISCLVTLSRPHKCARRCMWTLLTRRCPPLLHAVAPGSVVLLVSLSPLCFCCCVLDSCLLCPFGWGFCC
jgi:hypothetical protein